jgi:hypothetical protein
MDKMMVLIIFSAPLVIHLYSANTRSSCSQAHLLMILEAGLWPRHYDEYLTVKV